MGGSLGLFALGSNKSCICEVKDFLDKFKPIKQLSVPELKTQTNPFIAKMIGLIKPIEVDIPLQVCCPGKCR